MESLINNPGYDNIMQTIFLLMDHETLITCRSVCQSLKIRVEDPNYWIKRCSKIGQSKSLTDSVSAPELKSLENQLLYL